MKAIDNVTIEVDYERPYFEFPDSDSPQGNPYVFWGEAIATIRKNGFRKEAEEITLFHTRNLSGMLLPNMSYPEQFNFLARFLNFESQQIGEDENYIYVRVNKANGPDFVKTKQNPLFNISDIDTLKELIEEGEDLGVLNCYDRNILHYVKNIDTLKFLLEENEKHYWFDLFDIDHFGGSILHTQYESEKFALILEYMAKESPELAQRYLSQYNHFKLTPAFIYITQTFNLFLGTEKNVVTEISEKEWLNFTKSLKILHQISPNIFSDLLNGMESISNNEKFKNNPLYYNKEHYLQSIFDSILETKPEAFKPKL